MEPRRVFLAIVLSMAILFGYQLFLVPQLPNQQSTVDVQVEEQAPPEANSQAQQMEPAQMLAPAVAETVISSGRDIYLETSLFSAVVSETGGGFKSFKLQNYKASLKDNSPVELITTESIKELPLYFSWGVAPSQSAIPAYQADEVRVFPASEGKNTLTMKATLPSGLIIKRTLTVTDQDYQMVMTVDVQNATDHPLQGAPYISMVNHPFIKSADNRWLFTGPAVYTDGNLQQFEIDELKEGDKSVAGNLDWIAYEGHYFMCGIIPGDSAKHTVTFSASGKDKVSTLLAGEAEVIEPQGHKEFKYTIYFGPKKISILKTVGANLERIVDFGWYDIIARPTLYLLNFLNGFIHNYGVAIILVTIIIKLLFWPISHKGMKSMKTMQKVQPKIAKLREKYKDDRERLNQEMMRLYQTYKINPLGGCLPMLLQIPVFFALYKVLLLSIELRHAPFMMWINDLSAPDRLYIGFDIPYLGGIPVLTLLMGGSMFLQQKMTPSAADPTQAKIMLFLPVVFTFMFLNFASGLVLYWFVNNLLSIGQQYVINRQTT